MAEPALRLFDPEAAEGAAVAEERRRAVRLLLTRPFLADSGAEAETFALVRRHQHWLQDWFGEQLGYRLVVDVEFARLHKRPVPGALARRERTRSGTPFDRRRYALVCLVLAALEGEEIQTTLTDLAEKVRLLTLAEDEIEAFDLERFAERQSFVDAVRFLVGWGILSLTDGDDHKFVDGEGDALYDVDGRRLTQLLTAALPPSLAASPEELGTETYPPTDEGANRRSRHRLMRRLVEEPVLYHDALGDAERAYLTSQRHYLLGQVETAIGLPVEVRREGLMLVDDGGAMSDLTFPATGTVNHAALLFADFLGRQGEAGEEPWAGLGELRAESERLLGEYGRHFSKVYREHPEGAQRLLDDALERLAEFGLAELHPEGVRPRPAIARFRADLRKEESGDE